MDAELWIGFGISVWAERARFRTGGGFLKQLFLESASFLCLGSLDEIAGCQLRTRGAIGRLTPLFFSPAVT